MNDLRFFAAVVDNGGFSAAARSLRLPKSRLSRRITILEDHLGVRLLERSTRHLVLTEVGRQVYEHARAAVIESEAIEETALRTHSEPRGLVRVSCPLGLQHLIAARLPAFLAKHPKLRMLITVSDRRIDLVHEGVDVAIRVRERLDTDADLQVRKIGMSRRILVASPHFIRQHGPLESLADLARIPLLSQQEHAGVCTWNLLAGDDGSSNIVSFEPKLATGGFELLLAAACAGIGVALLPAANCETELTAGRLTRVLPHWSGTDGILHIIFTSRRGMLPGVRAVVDFVCDVLKEAVD
ncbi:MULTISPECIES: LysR substrate-binding domain-containing protein [Rhizobium]|uniref:LysR substrate-binding domain-containing protein n=1 Tax=Rhizobium TaxID=379 RepID=UPI001AD7FAC9|nr:LysR substrate-binding domain-containing protein [Rhizobium miluonense]